MWFDWFLGLLLFWWLMFVVCMLFLESDCCMCGFFVCFFFYLVGFFLLVCFLYCLSVEVVGFFEFEKIFWGMFMIFKNDEFLVCFILFCLFVFVL